MLSFAVDPHQRPKDWHATLRTTRSDRSRQVTLGRWPDQPGSISRDVSVDNSVSWPNVGPHKFTRAGSRFTAIVE
jgi:hypothetical protein